MYELLCVSSKKYLIHSLFIFLQLRELCILNFSRNCVNNFTDGTHQNLLQGINGLILNWYTVDLSDLITNVKSGLSMDHPTVHNPRNEALPVLVHFQRDSLKKRAKSAQQIKTSKAADYR